MKDIDLIEQVAVAKLVIQQEERAEGGGKKGRARHEEGKGKQGKTEH